MLKTPDIPATTEELPAMRLFFARPDWMKNPPVSTGD
jgi:hypothetical protein